MFRDFPRDLADPPSVNVIMHLRNPLSYIYSIIVGTSHDTTVFVVMRCPWLNSGRVAHALKLSARPIQWVPRPCVLGKGGYGDAGGGEATRSRNEIAGHPSLPLPTRPRREDTTEYSEITLHKAASYPPLQKTQGRGTLGIDGAKKKSKVKGRATRHFVADFNPPHKGIPLSYRGLWDSCDRI